jgi:hypothetical protein
VDKSGQILVKKRWFNYGLQNLHLRDHGRPQRARISRKAENSVQLSHDISYGALLAHDCRVQIAASWANIVNCLLINFGFFPDCGDPLGTLGNRMGPRAATNSVQPKYHQRGMDYRASGDGGGLYGLSKL